MNKKDTEILAKSENMLKVLETAKRIATFNATVLITGESGTGKEVMADYIVRMSERADKPFIRINCAAIPETLLESELFGYEKSSFTGADSEGRVGVFEAADGGTLLLDEIGDMPIGLQAKLLRVIQEKEIRRVGSSEARAVDVRIIAATNANLQKAVESGTFREDLYYRLNIVPITIPPLRERRDDIDILVQHFMDKYCVEYNKVKKLNHGVMSVLRNAPWKGNVRELKNIIERCVINTDHEEIDEDDIKELFTYDIASSKYFDVDKGNSLKEIMEGYEKIVLREYVDKYRTVSEVARQLKVNKSTISRKLEKYGLTTS